MHAVSGASLLHCVGMAMLSCPSSWISGSEGSCLALCIQAQGSWARLSSKSPSGANGNTPKMCLLPLFAVVAKSSASSFQGSPACPLTCCQSTGAISAAICASPRSTFHISLLRFQLAVPAAAAAAAAAVCNAMGMASRHGQCGTYLKKAGTETCTHSHTHAPPLYSSTA